MSIRVRFAPSPTGYLHVGGARTALFNWLLARREGGVFILRIEDTDRDRSTQEMVGAILEGMAWLGLDWDEGPVFQGEGVERHQADALRLLEKGLAYRDFTSPEELARIREEDPDRAVRYPREQAEALAEREAEERAAAGEFHAIRLLMPEGETTWNDAVHGELRFPNDAIEDLVILRSDGTPTYNLAVASDDAQMGITHVIRGDDHISNTPKQIVIHRGLGSPVPVFAHVPMILGSDGKRLSKRHGALAVGEYRKQGILPQAMVNFLALLGWSPGTDEEVMTREELVERFSLERVLKKSAVFDPEKLEWLNGRHLAALPRDELARIVLDQMAEERPEAERRFKEDRQWFLDLLDLLKARARKAEDIVIQARPYLLEEVAYDPDAVTKHWEKRPDEVLGHLEALRQRLEGAAWDEASLERELRLLAEERGVGAGKLIHPLRVALTGQPVSPGIFEVLVAMGRERSLGRLRAATDIIRRKIGETHES
jgi:glutamyl-tRNA synthetase